MTPKEYLQQAYRIDRQIKLDLDKASSMRAALYHSGASADERSRAAEDVRAYEAAIDAKVEALIQKRLEIERAIAAVTDDVLHEILTRRYLSYESWQQIAVEMHICLRHVYRLHGYALAKLAKNVVT